MRTAGRIAIAAIAIVVIATACTSGDDSGGDGVGLLNASSADVAEATFAPGMDAQTQPFEVDDDGAADRGSIGGSAEERAEPPAVDDPSAAQQIRNQVRDIIFTADLSVAATDVATAAAEAIRIVEGHGGFVFSRDSAATPEAVTTLTFRVPPDGFQQALDDLATIGDVRTQSVAAEDVTGTVVDLESRIATAEASVERLRTFLEGATDVQQVAQLERELLDRETQLETLRGQLRTIRDHVSLATIVVRLSEALANPSLTLAVSAYPGHDDAGASCPGQGNLAVDEGSAATLCVQLTNSGDTPLSSIELTDSVLGIELDDMIVVFGDPGAVLEPGQMIDLAYEVEIERDLRTQTKVTAVPVNADGDEVDVRQVAQTASLFVNAIDPGGLPGFADGLAAGWDLLQNIVGVAILSLGAILPFVWLIPLLWLALRWRRRRIEDGGVGIDPDPTPAMES